MCIRDRQRLADRQIPKKLEPNGKTTKASSIYDIDIHDALEVLNDQAFTLTTIDKGVLDSFHNLYTQRENERQLQAVKLAEQKALAEQAHAQAIAEQKQAELDAQKREQQALKAQKLEQKRLRQQQIDAKKQAEKQKQQHKAEQKRQAQTAIPTSQNLVKTPNNAHKSPLQLDYKARNILIIFGLVSLVVLALIMFALVKR